GASGMRSQRFAIGMLNVAWLGDLIKCLYWRDGGLCLFAKRLVRGGALRGLVLTAVLCCLTSRLHRCVSLLFRI
ncbi:hypothetical protein, partial [Paraburkholderia xenovorans]|uniref:hypothetical protein n=1 Tax=Paraburkholderia xenovorans TaxID=36873 RepID=UPI0038BD46CA